MIDPILLSVGSGAAGAFANQVASLASSWLRERFSGHTDKAYSAARANSEAFLINLSNRLQMLEDSGDTEASFSKKLNEAMESPDVAAALQDALYSSARTNDSQKHDLLSRAITERMLADGDGLQALATNQALSVIPRLHTRHLDNLGLATLLYGVRPNLPRDSMANVVESLMGIWLEKNVSLYLPIANMDAQHLVANGCLIYQRNFSKNLRKILAPDWFDDFVWTDSGFFDSDVGKTVLEVWGQFATHCDLTSVGHIIGIYVHDSKSRIRTNIDW